MVDKSKCKLVSDSIFFLFGVCKFLICLVSFIFRVQFMHTRSLSRDRSNSKSGFTSTQEFVIVSLLLLKSVYLWELSTNKLFDETVYIFNPTADSKKNIICKVQT